MSLQQILSSSIRQQRKEHSHLPLYHDQPSIRLLEWVSQSVGWMTSEHMLEGADYQALSYTWGTEHRNQFINLNEQYLGISDKLAKFLETKHAKSKRWWIDQICINQEDEVELSSQVSMMADIYRRAKGTLVWLDGLKEQTCQTLSVELSEGLKLDWEDPLSTDTLTGAKHVKFEVEKSQACSRNIHRRERIKNAVFDFFNHGYWSRVWIRQELLCAIKVDIAFDAGVISLQQARLFLDKRQWIELACPDSPGLWLLENATTLADASNVDIKFSRVVVAFKHAKCKDRRDLVYGVQGIIEESHRVPVDYTKSVSEVLFDAIKLLVRKWETGEKRTELLRTCFILAEGMEPDKFELAAMLPFLRAFADLADTSESEFCCDTAVERKVKRQIIMAFYGVLAKSLPENALRRFEREQQREVKT